MNQLDGYLIWLKFMEPSVTWSQVSGQLAAKLHEARQELKKHKPRECMKIHHWSLMILSYMTWNSYLHILMWSNPTTVWCWSQERFVPVPIQHRSVSHNTGETCAMSLWSIHVESCWVLPMKPHLNPQGQLIFYPSAMFFVWVQELNRTTHGSFFRREMRGIKFLKIFGHSFQWSIHSIWMCFFDQCSKFASFWCCRIRDLEIYGTLSTIYCHSNTIYATFEGAFTQGAFQGIGPCC